MPGFIPPPGYASMFVALMPDVHTRAVLGAWADRWRWAPGTVRTKPERFHLTLHFLGNVREDYVAALREALNLPFDAFELRLGLPDVWRQGVAVVRPIEIAPGLRRLHSAVGDALRSLGMAPQRSEFVPHVTLAREAKGSIAPPELLALRRQVHCFSLIRSELQRPVRYLIEGRFEAATAQRGAADIA
jgi:RNA 2',3'-cyclic 3'-phosphodiesterase